MSENRVASAAAAVPHEQGGAGAPVDFAHLQRYTLGDRSLELEVLHLFAAQAPLTMEVLRRAHTARAWRDAAHTLKGSARAVGAWQVARCAEKLEQLAGSADEACAALERLERALDEASQYIRQLLADR
jgi:HPt (histidine-containing phosphotransfer) domain-containing protein